MIIGVRGDSHSWNAAWSSSAERFPVDVSERLSSEYLFVPGEELSVGLILGGRVSPGRVFLGHNLKKRLSTDFEANSSRPLSPPRKSFEIQEVSFVVDDCQLSLTRSLLVCSWDGRS